MNMLRLLACAAAFAAPFTAGAASPEEEMFADLEKRNVEWTEPGATSADSMPLGNGDIGLNVWAEPGGDVCFYISKTDAWSEDAKGNGPMKLGLVRISAKPDRLKDSGGKFSQTLKLREGEIIIKRGDRRADYFRIWVDANNPAVNVDIASDSPSSVKVSVSTPRVAGPEGTDSDIFLKPEGGRIAWLHHNKSRDPHTDGLAFGAVAGGENFRPDSERTLVSKKDSRSHRLSVYPLTMKAEFPEQWRAAAAKSAEAVSRKNYASRLEAHRKWWEDFWKRSWIIVEGDEEADFITTGYALQRFITACAGRGAYPIKFNGSIFTTDRALYEEKPRAADYRTWGAQYWFQNTRPMYWARLMAGDFDMMKPLFDMYSAQIPLNSELVQKYYGHGGAYFAETAPFYGGFDRVAAPDSVENWTAHYFLPIIELSMMGLDYYEYTLDSDFAKNTLVPMASAGVQFYLEHFGRDEKGRLLLDPCNSIEQFWKAKNPAPDIAGLRAVSERMLKLKGGILPASARAPFEEVLKILPPLPEGERNGKTLLFPYEGPQTMKPRNSENPELYAVYPFRLFGIGKPGYKKALDTFNGRVHRHMGCWAQDPVQAAMLGLADTAKTYVAACFSPGNREKDLKFPAFWRRSHDYAPDQDNGGNGEHGLQRMIMHPDGRKLYMLPAFPANWSASFRLAAPGKTVVTGKIKNGAISEIRTLPESRRADIVDASKMSFAEGGEKPAQNLKDGELSSLLGPAENARALRRTKAGGENALSAEDEIRHWERLAFDGNTSTKHMNSGQDEDGFNPRGVNTGLVIEAEKPLSAGAIQFVSAPDMPSRDPMKITLEGSNSKDAMNEGFGGWTPIYSGSSGLEAADMPRQTAGKIASFKPSKPFKYFRLLVTQVRGDQADGVQYSEFRIGK